MKKSTTKYTFDHTPKRCVWVSTSDRNVGKCVTPAVIPQPVK